MNRIRELRLALGYRQKDLAEMIGCAENSISNYEKRSPRPGSWVDQPPLRDLLTARRTICSAVATAKKEPAGQTDELTLDVSDLTPENRQRVEDYLRILFNESTNAAARRRFSGESWR